MTVTERRNAAAAILISASRDVAAAAVEYFAGVVKGPAITRLDAVYEPARDALDTLESLLEDIQALTAASNLFDACARAAAAGRHPAELEDRLAQLDAARASFEAVLPLA